MKKNMFIIEPPTTLLASILARISGLERRAARLRLGICSALALLSAAALVPALQYAGEQFADSGFYDYLSLFLTNHDLALTYWREFAFSLAESLPSIALLLLIPICAALLWSIRAAWRSAPVAFAL